MIMKKIIASILLLTSSLIHADEVRRTTTLRNGEPISIIKQYIKGGRLYIGPDVFWADESPTLKHAHVRDESVYYGLRIGYDYYQPNTCYAGFDGLYAFGRMHLHAKNRHGERYSHMASAGFANAEGRVGYNFFSQEAFYFSPYVGIGGYYVRPYHVDFTQNWLYAALGVKANYVVGPVFTFGVNVKGMSAFYLSQKFRKHNIVGSEHTARDNLGYEIALPFSWKIGTPGDRSWNVDLQPYYLKLNTKTAANVAGLRMTFGYLF
jgi:hypothetical protein